MPDQPSAVCVSTGCDQPALAGRDHCNTHHARRRETWRTGRKDYRDRQTARTELLTRWARLLHGTIAPATGEAYRQNDLAMYATERLISAFGDRDVVAQDTAFAQLADALDATRAELVLANSEIMAMERLTGPLAHAIDPPPRPRESRAARLRREDELPT